MKTTYHLCIDVNGVLKMRESEFNRQFEGVVRDDNGRLMSVAEVRKYFEDARAKGHRVVPSTSECVGFDFQTGRPGHQVKELKDEIEEAMQARDWGRIERLANADLRHRTGSEPFDYLRHWCNVGRVFAYATNDYTWGEFEKEFAIIVTQVAQGRVLSDLVREYKHAKDAGRRAELWAEIARIVEE